MLFAVKHIFLAQLRYQNNIHILYGICSCQVLVTTYLGVTYNPWFDQPKTLLHVQCKSLANSVCFKLIPIAVKAHWPLIAERYHDPLLGITQKLVSDHPAAPLSLIIYYANFGAQSGSNIKTQEHVLPSVRVPFPCSWKRVEKMQEEIYLLNNGDNVS